MTVIWLFKKELTTDVNISRSFQGQTRSFRIYNVNFVTFKLSDGIKKIFISECATGKQQHTLK